ncbi:hypothetical protein ACFQ0T_17130 [Kitasatospora gansuensis]
MGESPDKVRRDGEGEEELSADSAGTGSSSTVQLRVRDVDSRTTMLRLPVDNATTMLKLPEEAEAEAVTSPDKPEAESAEPVEEPRAVDPRLAVRDAKDEADVAGSEVEPEVEVEAAEVAEVEVAEVAEVEAEAPEAVAEAGPVKLAKPPVQVWTVPEPAALPAEEPAPLPMPETTSEAMEVLAALSARPVSPFRRGVKRVTVWSLFVAVVIGAVVAAQLLRPLPDPKVKLSLAGSYTFTGSPLTLPW